MPENRTNRPMIIEGATHNYELWLAEQIPLVPRDLRLKHTLMNQDAFFFLRAMFYRWMQMWSTVCPEVVTAPGVLAVGDLPVENFWTRSGKSLSGTISLLAEIKRPPIQAASCLLPLQVREGALNCARSFAAQAPLNCRMLKMASRQGRRELGDRIVPLRYVAGKRATENGAGGHFQHPATCPFPRMPNTSSAPSSIDR
jgi:hypothetical protein